ncbi:hypothetical protein EY643_04095 [Halioglobus maricola]|uniref:Uncharacterized protein n=1 Tax=Halioglobus maricola TaxID=2601894 RepID=A0A5P9NH78_9GAMM|nr:hypothetical protein [Halioglobus maricola]QFU74885.1 hypothetical protein EY643_04095 [Halioglobus maricola]
MPRTTGQKFAIALPMLLAVCSAWLVLEEWLGEGSINVFYAIMLVFALVMMAQRIGETGE